MFFARQPLLQSTPARENKDQAQVVKLPAQIQDAWRLIFERRRVGEPYDGRSIYDPDQLGKRGQCGKGSGLPSK